MIPAILIAVLLTVASTAWSQTGQADECEQDQRGDDELIGAAEQRLRCIAIFGSIR